MNQMAGTRVCISFLHAYTLVVFASSMQHTATILNILDIISLEHNDASHFNTHPISFTTFYVASEVASTSNNGIIMIIRWIWIHVQLTVMPPIRICNGNGKATSTAIIATSVITEGLVLHYDQRKGFIMEHILGLIQI